MLRRASGSIALAFALELAACGGGGNGVSPIIYPNPPAQAPTSWTISNGTLTARFDGNFGAVDGVYEYDVHVNLHVKTGPKPRFRSA